MYNLTKLISRFDKFPHEWYVYVYSLTCFSVTISIKHSVHLPHLTVIAKTNFTPHIKHKSHWKFLRAIPTVCRRTLWLLRH